MQNTPYSSANRCGTAGETGYFRVGAGDQCITLRQWPGSGPTLFLVHGIGSSAASWESLAPALGASFTPIAMDLRGHGDSGKPEHGYLYDDYVADFERVFTALDITRPLIMGHSLGGILTLWWAARHPGAAAGIVAVDAPLRSGEEFVPAFDGWLAQHAMTPDKLTSWYLEKNPGWSEEQARRRAMVMTGTARNVFVELRADSLAHHGVDRLDEIEHVTSPVLLVRGDPDAGSMVHPEDAAALATRLPNARVEQIPGAGHSLHRERQDEFLAFAVPFMHECAREAGLA